MYNQDIDIKQVVQRVIESVTKGEVSSIISTMMSIVSARNSTVNGLNLQVGRHHHPSSTTIKTVPIVNETIQTIV